MKSEITNEERLEYNHLQELTRVITVLSLQDFCDNMPADLKSDVIAWHRKNRKDKSEEIADCHEFIRVFTDFAYNKVGERLLFEFSYIKKTINYYEK